MKIEDLVLYICKKYPIPDELSKARITKLVYLADWEYCKRTGEQLTGIQWYFHNFGPYVDDVVDAARHSKSLKVIETQNSYGDKKELICAEENSLSPTLKKEQREIIDLIMNETKTLYWNDFIKHVYSTEPIVGSNRYTYLDMKHFARQVRKGSHSAL